MPIYRYHVKFDSKIFMDMLFNFQFIPSLFGVMSVNKFLIYLIIQWTKLILCLYLFFINFYFYLLFFYNFIKIFIYHKKNIRVRIVEREIV